jgi:5-methyltetrahydrofolate--homocysteine methyltransferase
MRFQELLQSGGIVFFDGSMGTRLQALGLAPGGCPEEVSRSQPDLVRTVHREYVEAGAQVILTNTFGANRKKLAAYGLQGEVGALTAEAVRLAREAAGDRAAVALSLGPTGIFLEPVGPMSFAEAFAIYSEPVAAAKAAGADLVVAETMSDIQEVRAVAVAVKEAGLPLVVTMTFEEDGRTVLGTPPEVAAAVAGAHGAVMLGANCSLGPKELFPIAETLVRESPVPVLVQPNAGLPRLEGERTIFPTGPEEFADQAARLAALGVRGIGGCCGTTPDHIRTLRGRLGNEKPPALVSPGGTVITSRVRALWCGSPYPLRTIGERINPTGKKKLSAELKAGKTGLIREEALGQAAAGADLLDVNVGVPGINERDLLPSIVRLVQNIVECPLVLDSPDPEALEAALQMAPGKPLLNSVTGKKESLERVLPLAARYGTAVLGLPLDAAGVPETAAERLVIVHRILEAAESFGLPRENLVIDGLTLAVGADQRQPAEILETVRRIRGELGLTVVLGVSNISFGLPARPVMNAAFLSMAATAGLDLAIINPYDDIMMGSLRASNALLARDRGSKQYLAAFGTGGKAPAGAGKPAAERTLEELVTEAVITGDAGAIVPLVEKALDDGMEPMTLSNELLIPALEEVGDRFGRKIFFLPQVIGAAEAAKAAFAVLKRRFPQGTGDGKGAVIIATVEGDIHDIGKNIVATLLENHGYRLIDLGTNVSPGKIVAEARAQNAGVIGLSALMTTTLPAMEETITALKEAGLDVPVVVGGAVVTDEYAGRIGATAFAADALEGVRVVNRLFGKKGN